MRTRLWLSTVIVFVSIVLGGAIAAAAPDAGSSEFLVSEVFLIGKVPTSATSTPTWATVII
jgi:hypothetical protein